MAAAGEDFGRPVPQPLDVACARHGLGDVIALCHVAFKLEEQVPLRLRVADVRRRRREQRVVRRMAIAGKLCELINDLAMEREVSRVERVAEPLRNGTSGMLWRSAMVCKASSLALSILPRKPRWARVLGGVLGNLGALATRFAIFQGGKASARDPHATLALQRSA